MANIIKTNSIVTIVFGVDEGAYFCQSYINDSLSIFPILYLGMTVSIAFLEWLACSKAIEAFLPALLLRTIGPPGCSVVYLETS